MKLLLVNTVASGGSIGAYLTRISRRAIDLGHEVAIASGSAAPEVEGVSHIAIGGKGDKIVSGIATRIVDRHGLTGAASTKTFIEQAQAFAPDIIHLHNIHGYYIQYQVLFEWLARAAIPVVWSLHDCWALTGHCAFFDRADCDHWQDGCRECPLPDEYPATMFRSSSASNFRVKREAFTSVPKLTLLPVSDWLRKSVLPHSFLKDLPAKTVKLDLDLDTFKPVPIPAEGPPTVFGAANPWNPNKDLPFFTALRKALPPHVRIRIAGHLRGQKLPPGIEYAGIITDVGQMVREYSSASVFVNPTLADNYPQTNREAIACGTPVVSRAIGGAVEDLIDGTGSVKAGSTDRDLIALVRKTLDTPLPPLRLAARDLAVRLYAGTPWLHRLFQLYSSLI